MFVTEALGFMILQFIKQGSYYYERLALEYPDKQFAYVDMFLQAIVLSSAKKLLVVSHLNPRFLYVLIILARFLKNSLRKEELISRLVTLRYPRISYSVLKGHDSHLNLGNTFGSTDLTIYRKQKLFVTYLIRYYY